MTRFVSKCPECGARLQATVPRYLDNVVIDVDKWTVPQYDEPPHLVWHGDSGITEHISDEVRIYCANDHPWRYEPRS